jgi:hypothetical protein
MAARQSGTNRVQPGGAIVVTAPGGCAKSSGLRKLRQETDDDL